MASRDKRLTGEGYHEGPSAHNRRAFALGQNNRSCTFNVPSLYLQREGAKRADGPAEHCQ